MASRTQDNGASWNCTPEALVALSQGQELEEHSLGSLASTGAVTSLLLSPQLRDAAKQAGRSEAWAREQLLSAIRLEQSNYWRWGDHGELDW